MWALARALIHSDGRIWRCQPIVLLDASESFHIMPSAQGHLSRLLVNCYVYDSVGDLAALTVGTGHIGRGGFEFGCFKGLHEARFFLE
jgi:hypothetical protein